MEENLNSPTDENLVSLNKQQNEQSNIAWYILSVLSWFLLIYLQFDDYFKGIVTSNISSRSILSLNINIPISTFKLFIFCMSLFGFIIYLIFTTCKRDENLLNSMTNKWVRFHFIPFLIASFIYILSQFFINSKTEGHQLAFLSIYLVLSFLGCISLIFIYIKTNLPCEWYIVFSIKKGFFSCLITYLWFLIYSFIIFLTVLKLRKERGINADKTMKAVGLTCLLLNNLGCYIFAFIFKDLLVLIANLFIYKDLIVTFISGSEEIFKESFGRTVGIIGIIIIVLYIVEIVFLSIRFNDKLFK